MGKQLAFIILFLGAVIGALFWVKSYSDGNIAYYDKVCPYGKIVITGKGYCLDQKGNPYFPGVGRNRMEPDPGRAGTTKDIEIK